MSHTWINKYEECDSCNYDTHRCGFCGESLDHEGYDTDGNLHDTKFCRPNLVEHEEGSLCTWPTTGDEKLDKELGRPNCYWDHVNNKLKEH